MISFEEHGDLIRAVLMVQYELLICPRCGSPDVTRRGRRWREIQTVPIGLTPVYLTTEVPRCECPNCEKIFWVSPPLPQPIEGSPIEWWISHKRSPK